MINHAAGSGPASSFAWISALSESNTATAPLPSSKAPTGSPRALARTNNSCRGTVVLKSIASGNKRRSRNIRRSSYYRGALDKTY